MDTRVSRKSTAASCNWAMSTHWPAAEASRLAAAHCATRPPTRPTTPRSSSTARRRSISSTNSLAVTFTGSIGASNSAGFTKSGAGTLTFAAPNAYLGTTTLSAGTLSLVDPGAIPAGSSITFTGGALQHTVRNTVDYSTFFAGSSSAIAIDTNSLNVAYSGSIAASNTGGLTKLGGHAHARRQQRLLGHHDRQRRHAPGQQCKCFWRDDQSFEYECRGRSRSQRQQRQRRPS